MRYCLNPNQKRLPFGGHHFHENGMMMKADTVDEVAELVHNFRLINGKPLGNPKQEIINYYARKFPWMVQLDLNPADDEPETEEYKAWRSWLSTNWGKPQGKYISRKEASFRWEKCKGCPHNVGKPWDSSQEATEFERKSLLLRRGEKIPENLCFCSLHRADIGVCSFLETPRSLSGKASDAPEQDGCWF